MSGNTGYTVTHCHENLCFCKFQEEGVSLASNSDHLYIFLIFNNIFYVIYWQLAVTSLDMWKPFVSEWPMHIDIAYMQNTDMLKS